MDHPDDIEHRLIEIDVSAPADSRRTRLLTVAKEFVLEKKDEILAMHLSGAGGATIVARYTSMVDSVVKAIYSLAIGKGGRRRSHALVALGGYGREELCLCSDIDIMLLHEGRIVRTLEAVNEYLLCFLWDLGFEVGHSVRSTGEALRLAGEDDTILTSMLESRVLAGESRVHEEFLERLAAQMKAGGVRRFIRKKERERKRAYRKAGGEIYHVEPNIKQTAGGLRDYHTGIWIALARFGLKTARQVFSAGLVTEEQFLRLEQALDFLWRVRNQMRLEDGGLQDMLTLSRQERIASAFGYPPSRKGALAVELFMQDYYTHAAEIHRFCQDMLRLGGLSETHSRAKAVRRGGKIERGLRIAQRRVYLPAKDTNWFRENPARILEVMWYSQKHGLRLSEGAASGIRANLNLIDDKFRMSPVARDYFMAILSDLSRVGSTVRQMARFGILGRYLPEFSAVKHLVRYDSFHQYPVDEHSLRALENLAAIPHLREIGADALKGVLAEAQSPEILSLAILLHDLGKSGQGPHVEEGVRIAEAVGQRLALSEKQMHTLRFLIQSHLKMTHLSQYRDLDDREIIRAFASDVGSEERLNLLYLLTFADLYAVRQGAWNDWKSALLFQLYSLTKQALARPAPLESSRIEYWETPKARAVCEYLKSGDFASVRKHLSLLSPRYLGCFSPKEVAEHMRMADSLRSKRSAVNCAPLSGYSLSQITVCARDRIGLFAEIVGAFASQQVSIVSAAIFTRSDGIAIDSFHVVDGATEGPLTSTKWALVKANLKKALRGELDATELIRRAERSPRLAHRTMSSLRRGVYFDNYASATHTVIDVEAPDRIGLLYDIASTLSSLGLNLSLAKIATDVRQARDAFYITDREGGKITNPLRIQEISEKLSSVLSRQKLLVSALGSS
jgi:[protein-PII] uridylyltransferase